MKKGDVVVEFDGSQQDQNVISRTTNVRAADGDIMQTKATQKINDEADAMSKMSERVRSGALQAGRQQGGGAFGDRRREEPDSGGRVRRLAADGEGVDQRAPGGPDRRI